ncbi:MAG: PilZ domain-containing protein [Labilithrix sp.]|nr:PilZ domain-containing protein [Labilithrix sp.]MCW5816650.1 PilZ domain-containing protein [Labilithrix sp.]
MKALFDYARRNVTRREVLLPCQAVREHDFKLIADRMLDLSTDGMLVPLRRQVLTGEPIIVSFSIGGMWIDAEATVARIVHGRRPGDDGIAAGLVFDPLSPSARSALAGYLHGRREPLPRRGPRAALRRGAEAPRLADEAIMNAPLLVPADVLADEADVLADDDIDALGILRAVATAWQQLSSSTQGLRPCTPSQP